MSESKVEHVPPIPDEELAAMLDAIGVARLEYFPRVVARLRQVERELADAKRLLDEEYDRDWKRTHEKPVS